MKRTLTLGIALLASTLVSPAGGDVTLAWDASLSTEVATDGTYRLYAAPGTNAIFAPSHTNATRTLEVPGTVLMATFTNLTLGAWTFVATATANGLESLDSNSVWTNVTPNRPGRPTALRISHTYVFPPIQLGSLDGNSTFSTNSFPSITGRVDAAGGVTVLNASTGYPDTIILRDAGGSVLTYVQLSTNGWVSLNLGGTQADCVDKMSAAVPYFWWYDFTPGDGTSTAHFAWSTNAVRPTSGNKFAGITGKTVAGPTSALVLRSGTFSRFLFDTTLVSDNPIP